MFWGLEIIFFIDLMFGFENRLEWVFLYLEVGDVKFFLMLVMCKELLRVNLKKKNFFEFEKKIIIFFVNMFFLFYFKFILVYEFCVSCLNDNICLGVL